MATIVAVAGGFLLIAAPASAAATSVLSSARVSIASSLAPPSSAAGPAEYDPTNISSVGGYAHTDEISVAMSGGTAQRNFSIDLQAPRGATFHPGTYYGDDVYGVRGNGSLIDGNAGCQGVQFTVVDVASSGTALTRLDLRFQTTCNYTSSANAVIFGELQLGEPAPAPWVMTGARSFAWPDVPVGTRSPALLPLWFRNTGSGSLAVGAASLSGANSGDFRVVSDGCSHKTLSGHTACSVVLAFAPHAVGNRAAVLTVPMGAAKVPTALAGTGPPGRTLLRLNSQPGDLVGNGRSYLMTDAQSQMQVANQSNDALDATTNDGHSSWTVEMQDRSGPIRVGTYTVNNASNTGFWLIVSGEGRGCGDTTGTVTIKQVSYDADNAPSAFDAMFSQSCTGSPHAKLTGEIAYHATNAATAPTGAFILHTGQSLTAGQAITNGGDAAPQAYKLAVTTAGRAVLTGPSGTTLWATPATAAAAHDRLTVTTTGTLALLSQTGSVLWATATAGSGTANFLVLQSDGNLVLNNADYQPVWATGTATVAD